MTMAPPMQGVSKGFAVRAKYCVDFWLTYVYDVNSIVLSGSCDAVLNTVWISSSPKYMMSTALSSVVAVMLCLILCGFLARLSI